MTQGLNAAQLCAPSDSGAQTNALRQPAVHAPALAGGLRQAARLCTENDCLVTTLRTRALRQTQTAPRFTQKPLGGRGATSSGHAVACRVRPARDSPEKRTNVI